MLHSGQSCSSGREVLHSGLRPAPMTTPSGLPAEQSMLSTLLCLSGPGCSADEARLEVQEDSCRIGAHQIQLLRVESSGPPLHDLHSKSHVSRPIIKSCTPRLWTTHRGHSVSRYRHWLMQMGGLTSCSVCRHQKSYFNVWTGGESCQAQLEAVRRSS